MTSRRWIALSSLLLLASACRPPAPVAARESIVIAVPHEVSTLDPHAEDTLANFAIHSNVYESLVMIDRTMRVLPCLATAWETPDPLTWVFHLRSGVRFHSGRLLTAADVVASYRHLLANKRLDLRTYLLDVTLIEERDPLTVVLKTAQPSSILLNRLTEILITPAQHGDLRTSADGTGPYAVAAWRPGERVDLRRHERYWGVRPPLTQATIVLSRGVDEAGAGLLAGRYDLVQSDSKQLERTLRGQPGFRLLRQDNLLLKYLGMDLGRAVTPHTRAQANPFRDLRVRQALHAALDRRALVDALPGDASPATQPVPRLIFGFNPAIPEAAQDLVRARALMKQAGFESGFDVVLDARRILGDAALAVKAAFEPVGVRVEVRLSADGAFYQRMARKDSSFWLSRFGCLDGDASEILVALFHSENPERGFGLDNWAGYANPRLDLAIEKSTGIRSPADRVKALQAIMSTTMDELVLIPLYNDQDVYGVAPGVRLLPRYDSLIRVAEISIAP